MLRIHQGGQGVNVGALELGDLAMVEQLPGQFMLFAGQVFQRLLSWCSPRPS